MFTKGNDRLAPIQPLFTVRQVAVALGVSTSAIYRWIDQGRLPCVRIASLVRFRKDDVEAILKVAPSNAARGRRPLSAKDDC